MNCERKKRRSAKQQIECRRFQRNIKKHISAAKEGSLEDLDILSSHENCDLLPEVPPAVIDIARSTLALPLPEDDLATEDTLYMCDRVCKCFKLLKMLHRDYFNENNCAILRTLWPDALRWLSYFRAKAASFDQERRYSYVVGLAAVLHPQRNKAEHFNLNGVRLLDCPCEHHARILDDGLEDKFFSLTCEVWADPNLPLEASKEASIALISFRMWTSYRQEVLLTVFEHPDDIAALSFLRLRWAMKDIMQCRRIATIIETIAFFLVIDDATVKAAFVDAGVIRRVIKLIMKFVSMGKARTMACTCALTMCFQVFIGLYSGVRRSSMQFALSALHHRVLEALLCTGWISFNTGGVTMVRTIATEYIPRFMCYKIYSSHCLKAMDNIQDDAYVEYGYPNSPAPFKNLWTNLNSYIMESSVLRNLDEMGLNEQKVWCDEPSCDVSGVLTVLKRCAGCKAALYCSRACQSKAWNAGHRELCAKIAKDTGYNPNECTKTAQYDKSLLIQIACTTVKRHLKSIKRIAAETFPGKPLERMLLYIDLKRRPHTMHLAPISRADESTCQYREHFQYFEDKVLSRIQRGCKRIVPMSIECANESTSFGGEGQLFVMADIDVDANLDLHMDERVVRGKRRASSLYINEQRLNAEYDVVDAVLDTMRALGRKPFKEESIQEAIEVHYGRRALELPESCSSTDK